MTDNNNKRSFRGFGKRRKLVLASFLAIAGIAGAGALAQGGGGHGPGGRGGEAMMMKRADHLLRSVDATPEQRDRVRAIMAKVTGDLAPVRASFDGTRGQFANIVAGARVDRDAAERLRAERIAAADQASKRMLTAVLDAAEVLTPEQRAKLKARFDARGRS